ncbi:hypothetical protein Tco_1432665, partial [Tanacetum coccineum]
GHHEKVKELVKLLELNQVNYLKIQKKYFPMKLGNSPGRKAWDIVAAESLIPSPPVDFPFDLLLLLYSVIEAKDLELGTRIMTFVKINEFHSSETMLLYLVEHLYLVSLMLETTPAL